MFDVPLLTKEEVQLLKDLADCQDCIDNTNFSPKERRCEIVKFELQHGNTLRPMTEE